MSAVNSDRFRKYVVIFPQQPVRFSPPPPLILMLLLEVVLVLRYLSAKLNEALALEVPIAQPPLLLLQTCVYWRGTSTTAPNQPRRPLPPTTTRRRAAVKASVEGRGGEGEGGGGRCQGVRKVQPGGLR